MPSARLSSPSESFALVSASLQATFSGSCGIADVLFRQWRRQWPQNCLSCRLLSLDLSPIVLSPRDSSLESFRPGASSLAVPRSLCFDPLTGRAPSALPLSFALRRVDVASCASLWYLRGLRLRLGSFRFLSDFATTCREHLTEWRAACNSVCWRSCAFQPLCPRLSSPVAFAVVWEENVQFSWHGQGALVGAEPRAVQGSVRGVLVNIRHPRGAPNKTAPDSI